MGSKSDNFAAGVLIARDFTSAASKSRKELAHATHATEAVVCPASLFVVQLPNCRSALKSTAHASKPRHPETDFLQGVFPV